ncbi:MAG: hypothetical protein L6Q71_09920 [Planctomycetes bacterium]|nr:hypothetical protein [Planctomycetota bacterium]
MKSGEPRSSFYTGAMAYIHQVPIEEAAGTLKRVYDQAMRRAGGVAGIIRVMSLTPEIVKSSMQFYVDIMKAENDLSSARKEMIATVVSNINDCYY